MKKKTIKAIKIMRDNLHKDLIQLEKEGKLLPKVYPTKSAADKRIKQLKGFRRK